MRLVYIIVLLLALILIIAKFSYASNEVEGSWTGTDKFEHLGASFIIGVVVAQTDVVDSKTAVWVIAMVPGLTKEYWFDTKPSYRDLIADAIGAYLGISAIRGLSLTNSHRETMITWTKSF
jgi:VanZ family protein